jgi:PTH1 family peptidyl-tRNA hydrolase
MATATTLIIGLGNPGADYENTYHNAGALALRALAASCPDGNTEHWEVHKKLFAYMKAGDRIFARTLTFMNVSGTAVREAARKFSVLPENIIILHDDSDLTLGTWKISRARGAAGHHGIESIVAALETNDFTRIRIGIRPPHEKERKKAEDFVLKRITKSSTLVFKKVFAEIADALETNIASS